MRHPRDDLLSLVSILRFGSRTNINPSYRLCTFSKIAGLLKISHTHVRNLCHEIVSQHQQDLRRRKATTRKQLRLIQKPAATIKKMTAEEKEFLVSPETLISMTGCTLEERALRLQRQFPGRKRSVYHVRKAYKEAGVKKRKISRTKILTHHQQLKSREEALDTRQLVEELEADGYGIYYLDEFCTTKSTMPTHEWTPRNHSF